MTTIHLLLAGLWPIVGTLSFGTIIVAACLAIACFTPSWIPVSRTTFLLIAGITAALMFAYAAGLKNEKARRDAQEHVIVEQIDDAVKNSGGKRDPFDDSSL